MSMSQTTEGMSEIVDAVRFSFMTDKEGRRHSVVKITNPILLDSVGRAIPGGLYDPAMGPLDDQTPCKSCCQRSFHCPGHFGHIDLISPVYNPLLFNMLYNLLQRTCFFCLHFRANRSLVEKCVSQLELIAKGDIVGAKMLDSDDSDGNHVSCSTVHSGDENHSHEHSKKQSWTSIQFTEAMSALDKFLKPKSADCKNCNAKNPTINKPTFGWFHMSGMSAAHTRANIIRDCKLEGPYTGGAEEKPSSEVVNADDSPLGSGLDPFEIDTFTTVSDGIEDSVTKKHGHKGKQVPQEFINQKNFFSGPLLPSEVRDIVKLLWENEPQLCSFICDIQHVSVMEHPQTILLGKVLQSNVALGNAHVNNSERSRIVNRWMDLQQSINVLFDSKTAMGQGQRDVGSGICQLLEKKEGIFRQKMMGKRVNYACRSVISPDPYLAVNEIGIPPYFATRLTYPERVTPWNVVKLRDAIINGSEIHPGATHYVDKLSTVKLPPSRKMRISMSRKLPSSRGVVTQSGKSCNYEVEGKIVYRHLQDGDIVLVNRQPTLHKPSIMAHVVRVLQGEKTLRMHYANCSTYNADFDGDEMNVHFPQDEVSRAEAYNIVNANNQYIIPTRGDTVRGLIQDHIVSAVLLTMKNTFLTCEEYNQLLYSSGVFAVGKGSFAGNTCPKVSIVNSEVEIQPVLPAVWKPKPLWTGKQVITTVLNHLTRHCKPFTVENEGKIPGIYFASEAGKNQSTGDKEENAENKLLIWKNELVRGVIDKAQFGKYGLVHTVQELYGSNTAGILLSALSRLFTVFLQIHGFTCGVDDLIISPRWDITRKENLEGENVGEEVHRQFVNFDYGDIGALKLQLEIEKAIHSNGQSATALLDMKMKNKLSEKGSKINQDLLRKGLLKPFPRNCISLMTISGAKGSTVNFQQISSFLGQQELEGKRVPRMVSGKTLPCFVPWDFSSRAGGFIIDRFLTGLRPQEYYFHCMAGREGLVDTAVKTSRSGYLQRCLMVWMYIRQALLENLKHWKQIKKLFAKNFSHQREFNTYIKELPIGLQEKAQKFVAELPMKKKSLKRKKQKDFLKLMKQKYLSSLAQSGEPVGVIAAQSIGEPSTQMTLNTFHLAGRGEMNVTLGIPRLQEILMTASVDILTPIMTCPLREGKSKEDAKNLVERAKKVTVADMIEYLEETLEVVFLRELEDAIQNHLLLLSKISGIKNFVPDSRSKASNDTDEDASGSKSQGAEEGDDDDDGEGDERAEDLGFDAQKIKQQATDEMNYEDNSEDESNEEDPSAELGEVTDQGDDGVENREDTDTEDEISEMPNENGVLSKPKPVDGKTKPEAKRKKKVRARLVKKDSDRAIFVEAKEFQFEVHFRFTNEPHVLLAQIAQKTAKKVQIKRSGKIDQCQVVDYNINEQVIWREEKSKTPAMQAENKKGPDTKAQQKDAKDDYATRALKTAGVDFRAFWEMQDDLDVSRIYSNNIHSMLNTFGVEAARAAIIREMKHVFKIYGVEIDFRHLSLIADYMTHSGGYRPMSRHGGIAESISPFIKMSFETASKFIVEAAYHGMTDNLETPSARICLGLPVKMGTGSFDLMHKLEI
ncbi:hypothetical protein F0562_001218 [Nyssa sinensis]|uniref:DNA-directed RNA polymerase subunit n=1 Tax=Nyssa sinensis TaxID=561372 RepID=A0A5J5C4K6_9ASTE|nr:hypothetical protein F0562_001218 [Nyssa sinensis]